MMGNSALCVGSTTMIANYLCSQVVGNLKKGAEFYTRKANHGVKVIFVVVVTVIIKCYQKTKEGVIGQS